MRILTGTYIKGGMTYSFTIKAPNEIVYIYSKHVFCTVQIKRNDGQESRPVTNRLIRLTIGEINEERRTNSDGTAVFDFARILQILKNDSSQELDINYNRTANLAHTTSRVVALKDSDEGSVLQFQQFSFETANGADDILDKFWTNNRRLRWFSNYPFTFDFQNLNGNWSVKTDNGSFVTEAFPYESSQRTRIMSRINARRYFASSDRYFKKTLRASITMAMDDSGNPTTVTNHTLELTRDNRNFDLYRRCYLRWLGKHGEIFYWLFTKHSETDSVKSDEHSLAYVDENAYSSYGVLESETSSNHEKETTITVYSDMLDNADYEIVRSLATSPFVDMLVSYSTQATPTSPGSGRDSAEESEGDSERTEESGGDNENSGISMTETALWQRVRIGAGNYTKQVNSDTSSVNKQLVFRLIIPKEGRQTI